MTDLDGFFSPRRVAVIGASESSGWTRMLLDGIAQSASPPEIVMVNPRRTGVHGHACVPSMADVDGHIDLAFVQTGAEHVVGSVEEALAAGVRDFVILSSGMGEAGAAGRAAEQRLTELSAVSGARILGPNVSGFVDLTHGITLFGLPRPATLRAGGVGLVLQSGGLATHALGLSAQWGIGISRMVTSGNEACVTASDIFAALVEDEHTTAVALFLESVRDPERFAQAATRARELGKPVVALAAGRSELGRSSALAHTGALVGDHAMTIAALEALGVVCVDTLEGLIATAGLLAHLPEGLPGPRLGVVAASGGACELIADRAAELGLELPPLDITTVVTLERRLPAGGAIHNPLDVTGLVVKDPDMVFAAADAFLDAGDRSMDALVFQSVTFPADAAATSPAVIERFRALGRLQRDRRAPVLLQTAATFALSPAHVELVDDTGVFILPGISIGFGAIAASVRSRRLRSRAARHADAPTSTPPADIPLQLAEAIERAAVPQPPREVVTTPHEVRDAAARVGLPVVVKVVSDQIAHKTEVGGVALDLQTAEEAQAAAEGIAAAVARLRPDAVVNGFEVAAMRRPGIELLAGIVADPAWGPMLTVGAGGVLSELLADVTTRALPVDRIDVDEMLASLRCAPQLDGYRGSAGVDRAALIDAILSLTRLWSLLEGRVSALEVNPISGRGDHVEVLDMLVEWIPAPVSV